MITLCWKCRGDDAPSFPAYLCDEHGGYWTDENKRQFEENKLEYLRQIAALKSIHRDR
jgi:hypothetical protein